ncbi:MAG: flagellar biosynthetic protein FliR [Candidatus Margulisiibacteriota bacterium]
MPYPILQIPTLIVYLLFFARVLGIMVSAPIFGARAIPSRIKIGFSLILAYLFYILYTPTQLHLSLDNNLLAILMLVSAELLLGIFIGYIALLIFSVIQFCGNLIDIMTGMHVASVLDPMTHEQQSLLGQFQYILALLLFLNFNGHHFILHALNKSFSMLPLGTLSFKITDPSTFIGIVNSTFVIGFQLATPIIAILFLIDFSLGIIAKGVPQMNVFMTGMPLKSMVGFFALLIALLYYSEYFKHLPLFVYKNIVQALHSL